MSISVVGVSCLLSNCLVCTYLCAFDLCTHPFPLKGKRYFRRVDFPLSGNFPKKKKYRKSPRYHIHGQSFRVCLPHTDPLYRPILQQCYENICKIKHFSPISILIILITGRSTCFIYGPKTHLLISWNDLLSLKRDFPLIDFPLSGNGCISLIYREA